MADLVRYNAEFEGDASNWLEVLLRSWQITALTPFDKERATCRNNPARKVEFGRIVFLRWRARHGKF